jgi:hypothetical protein
MVTAIRRLFWLAILGGAGYAGWSALQRRSAVVATPSPPNSPIRSAPASSPSGEAQVANSVALWVPALDGGCPDGYPIKANTNSGIYHVPGGRFYERTRAERCYAHTADAEADGYRRAKA